MTASAQAVTCNSVVHLASAPNPVVQGFSLTFTTGVTGSAGCLSPQTPTGTVALTDTFAGSTASLGTITLDATGAGSLIVSTLLVGMHSIGASYGGDANYLPGTAQALVQTVIASATATTTSLTSSVNPSSGGQNVIFTAAISPHQAIVAGVAFRPTGTVAFFDGSTLMGTALVVNGAGTFSLNSAILQFSSLAAGSHNIRAVYSGDNVFSASTSAVLIQFVSGGSTGTLGARFRPRSAQVHLYFPHLTNGLIYTNGVPSNQQWQATFTFVNVDASDANVTLRLYDDNGNPATIDFGSGAASVFTFKVPSNGIQILKGPLVMSMAVSGWAYAESDVPLQASATYRMLVNGVALQEVAAQPTLPTVAYTSAASAFLGIALANPSPINSTNVSLTLSDPAGKQVDGVVSLTIPPHGHTAFNLWQRFPSLQANLSFTGVLYVQGLDPTRPDSFVGWTVNSDASTVLSMLSPGDSAFPISHLDRIWNVWSVVLETASGLDPSFSATGPVNLKILSDQQVNAFAPAGGAEVDLTYALSQLINDSDSELAFALGHMLGHVYQQRNGSQMKYVPGNAEADADQWALAIMLGANFDPYSLPGALGKLALATNNSQLTSTFDGQSATSAFNSLNLRYVGAFAALQQACSGSSAPACQSYKAVAHPGFPLGAP